MENIFSIVDKCMTIHLLQIRLEAIQNYPHPRTVHDCESFCGVINYLIFFCKDLQKQPIHFHLDAKCVKNESIVYITNSGLIGLPPSELACTTAAIYDFDFANFAKNICYAKSHLKRIHKVCWVSTANCTK